MKGILTLLAVLICCAALSVEKLLDPYLVQYGSPEAPVKIIQYYSLTCPHCVALFRKQFKQIKESFIQTGKIHWTFHPVPMDLQTVQVMDCFSKLTPKNREIFLEAILEELAIDRPAFTARLMQKGMEVLENPIPDLQEKAYLSETAAFTDAFNFLKANEDLNAVPAVEVNGRFFKGEIPNIAFIERVLFESGEN